MKLVLPIVIGLVVVGVGTFFQGIWSERWGRRTTEKLVNFTERLDQVPARFGDWIGTEEAVDQEQFEASNCDGCYSYSFLNERTGESVSVYLVSGTGRHVTIHTPNWCYQAAGYKMGNDYGPYTIEMGLADRNPEFVTATFTKQDEQGTSRLRIFWTYSDDGIWHGPTDAKRMFGMRSALYKVYFINQMHEDKRAPEDSPTLEFAKRFLPEINKILFPPQGASDQAVAANTAT